MAEQEQIRQALEEIDRRLISIEDDTARIAAAVEAALPLLEHIANDDPLARIDQALAGMPAEDASDAAWQKRLR